MLLLNTNVSSDTVCVCASWTKHWCLWIFCLTDLVENFDEASKNEANWFFIPPLAVLLFVTVNMDSLRAFPLYGDVKGAVHHCWGLEPVRWPPGTTRYAHPDVRRLYGTLLQQRSRACFQGQFNILANYHIPIIAVAIWVGMFSVNYLSVCCFEIWKVETAAAKKTKWRYFIMWWMCRSQLVQCFGVVKLCVWWVFSLGDVKTTGADSRWRPYTHSFEYS